MIKQKQLLEVQVHPVDELKERSKQHHWGIEYLGKRPPLLFPEEEEGFIWYPLPMFPKPIHEEALRRHELIKEELPHIEIVQVVIGDEIEEPGRDWEADAEYLDREIKAGAEKVKRALPTVAKIGLIGLAAVAAVPLLIGAAVVFIPLAILGAAALDPKYVLVVSDGQTTHWINIFSWMD